MDNDVLVYDGWLKVYRRNINDKAYDILKNYDAVAALITNEMNDVLLVKQFRPSIMEETLEIPAGCLDIEGETIEDCLLREVKEETGIDIQKNNLSKITSYRPLLGFCNSTLSLYHIKIKKSDLKNNMVNDSDVKEVFWLKISDFNRMIEDGIITDSKSIMSYMYLKAL